ncbi:autoinducer binding domain-containing protein [Mesorhizobium sp. M0998]|uniref:autoinducer binding domain-containing protein n=1 Tax=Mesorhizobium sp. M0998 TaxID=2957044 RepID=UPI00333AF966
MRGFATSQVQQRLFDEEAEFGICCGLTIPIIHRRGCNAAVTFAADEPYPAFLRVAERYDQALQLMATCFHIHVRHLQWAARGKSA